MKTARLSSGLLQMKFMTKTRKKAEEQEEKEKIQELKKEFITDVKMEEGDSTSKTKRNVEYCKDLTVLEDLSFGRMSFKGFNPEKLMVYYERKRRGEESEDDLEDDDEADITDAQMAKTLAGAASSIANKFKDKRSHSRMLYKTNETKKEEVNSEMTDARLNFDVSSIRKRKSGPEDFSHPPKFLKPSY